VLALLHAKIQDVENSGNVVSTALLHRLVPVNTMIPAISLLWALQKSRIYYRPTTITITVKKLLWYTVPSLCE